MHTSSIIEELHALRRRYAERFGDDLHAICEDARRKQADATSKTTHASQPRRCVTHSPASLLVPMIPLGTGPWRLCRESTGRRGAPVARAQGLGLTLRPSNATRGYSHDRA